LADPRALQHEVVNTLLCKLATDGQPSLTGANDDDPWLVGRSLEVGRCISYLEVHLSSVL
jgi:hypothetical protein